ncbi:hypothetical protein ACF8EF_22265 [Pseudomonas sp. zjy_15]
MKTTRLVTLLDTAWPEYRDTPWKPRGHKVFNGFRQAVRGIQL